MKAKPGNQSLFIISWVLFIIATSSCINQSQSNKENKAVHPISDTSPRESGNGAIRLKYTTGVRSILEDSKGDTWFGSYNEGVCLLRDGKLHYFTTENGLSNNQVRSIYEDKNGIIWFECGIGLSTYDGQKISVYTERNFDSLNEWKLTGKDLWFKSDGAMGYNKHEEVPGVYQYNGKKLSYRKFPLDTKPGQENLYLISTPFVNSKNGTVWFGTYGAAIGYNGSDFKIIDNEYLGLTGDTRGLHIRSIMEDSKGNLWIGNNGMGVLKYDGKRIVDFTGQQKLKKEHTRGNSLERVFSIGEDGSGNIWFGTVESGVWRYDGNTTKNFSDVNGPGNQMIWTIHKSKQGELWFGGAGVYRFNGTTFERIF